MPHPPIVCLQSDVWEADFWDGQWLPPPLPGQPVCMFPDTRTCVFCHGVHGGRRPHDAHTCGRLFRATCCVSSAVCVCVCVCVKEKRQGICVFLLYVSFVCAPYEASICSSLYVQFSVFLSVVYPTGSTQVVWSWDCSFFMTIRLYIGEYLDCLHLCPPHTACTAQAGGSLFTA